jgi:cobalt-zinc-cadmium efflux system membrane fusion protein
MKKYPIFAILLLLLNACGSDSVTTAVEGQDTPHSEQTESQVSFTKAQLESTRIETGFPQLESSSNVLHLQGSIDVPPQSTVSISFPLGGYLKSTRMLPGMHVRKGQVLAELEDMQFIQLQQDYLIAKEKLALAETEFARQKDLISSKASSDKIFQLVKTEMETQRIATNALARKLDLIGIDPQQLKATTISASIPILSPISGYVSKVNVNVGKYTAPTDQLFELVDPRDIHLALNVFEKDLNALSIGQEVTAYTNNEPDKKRKARIILINKNLDGDRMAEVHCHFEKFDPSLTPGMFVNGDVLTNSQKALTVPEDAIVRWENKFYVFKDNGSGNFEMTEVTPGPTQNGRQLIDSTELDSKTSIVTKNAHAVLMKIKNKEEED